MQRPIPTPFRAVVVISVVAIALLLICSLQTSRIAPANSHFANPPIGRPNSQAEKGQNKLSIPGTFTWGGALNSAELDGKGFFDLRRARLFNKSLPSELSKYVIELNSRAFLPDPSLASSIVNAGKNTIYLQFFDHPNEFQRQQLKAKGIELLEYVSGYAWTARASDGWEAALKMDFVRAVAAIDPRDKMHPQVFSGDTPPYALTADGLTRFSIVALPGTSNDEILKQIAASPALSKTEIKSDQPSVLGPRFEILAQSQLAVEIAALENVMFLEHAIPPAASRDATTDLESNVPDVRDTGPTLNGSTVTVAVREIGKMDSHADFARRLTFSDTDGTTDAGNVNHATAVTGQIASSGVNQPTAKGIAPAVNVVAYSLTNDTFATTDIINAAALNIRISNHSYGPSGLTVWGDYRTLSADWDTALHDNNLIAMFASNEETGGLYKHVDHFVGAKNTICVAASSSSARAGSATIAKSDGIAYFSEFGPMNDGRVKPDLVADGDTVTLDQGTNSTQINSGTSFACPATTGVAAIVFQRYKQVVGAEPSGALMKALLLNSATDLGAAGPDATYGFGIVNAAAAVSTINARTSATNTPFLEGVVSNGTSAVFTVNIQDFSQLKATLCWQDVAGNPSASKALVNDLDLQVIAPDGTTFFPYSLDPANPQAPATNTGPNHVDNVEQTIVNNPINGVWTIQVTGTSIPSGSQSFAVCLNLVSLPSPLTPSFVASPQNGPVSLDVSFSAVTSQGQIQSYDWIFGDGSAGNGLNVEHVYDTPGTYTVMLTLTDVNQKQASTTLVITATKREVDVFPISASARLDFSKSNADSIAFSIIASELVETPQQARDALRNGTFEGQKYLVRLAGAKIADSIVLDQRASFKHLLNPLMPDFASFKINLPKGRIDFSLTHTNLAEIFQQQGMTSQAATDGTHYLPIEIEASNVIYKAKFKVQYKSNGKGATATPAR